MINHWLKRVEFSICLLSILTIAVLIVGTLRGKSSINDYFELRQSQQVLEKTVEKLKTEVSQLESEITKVQKSRSYALKVLRDKYHVTQEGENIIFLSE